MSFRDKVVGHISHNDLTRPFLAEKVQAASAKVAKDDPEGSIRWINPVSIRQDPQSVMAVVERVRVAIGKKYDVDARDPPDVPFGAGAV